MMWSSINNADDWTAAAPTQTYVLPDGGWIVGEPIEEATFREMLIRRLDYETPPKIVRWSDADL